MSFQSSIILTYKGKILLFSKDVLVETDEENYWDFLRLGKLKNKAAIDFLRNEISLTSKEKTDDEKLTNFVLDETNSLQLFHFRLTDANVNGMKRRQGWRLEFYRFNELEKIALSDEARLIFNQYNDQIKALLTV